MRIDTILWRRLDGPARVVLYPQLVLGSWRARLSSDPRPNPLPANGRYDIRSARRRSAVLRASNRTAGRASKLEWDEMVLLKIRRRAGKMAGGHLLVLQFPRVRCGRPDRPGPAANADRLVDRGLRHLRVERAEGR